MSSSATTNIMTKEKEQLSPYLKDEFGNGLLIPPPEDLIAKSVFMQEPIRTGAPINFMYIIFYEFKYFSKLEDLKGGENKKETIGE